MTVTIPQFSATAQVLYALSTALFVVLLYYYFIDDNKKASFLEGTKGLSLSLISLLFMVISLTVQSSYTQNQYSIDVLGTPITIQNQTITTQPLVSNNLLASFGSAVIVIDAMLGFVSFYFATFDIWSSRRKRKYR